MKRVIFFALIIGVCFCSRVAYSKTGELATEEGVALLKQDLLLGKIVVGKTRLKDIRDLYGEAPTVTESDKKVVYNYGDLTIEFDKKRYWKSWERDTFKKTVYTDDVDDLRFDLASEALVGENIIFSKIVKKYDEPTESQETNEDGGASIYYYGDIKMIFENVYAVRNWRGQNMGEVSSEGVFEVKK